VHIGTGVLRVGRSSIQLLQYLYQNGECVAHAETVIVQVEGTTKKGKPLTQRAKDVLNQWIMKLDD
jgi:acyl-CoA thioester hydrolase